MNNQLKKKMIAYYTKYYRDICSLPNYQKRVANRLEEEENEKLRIERLKNILNTNFNNQKHFIFGAGTGGLAVVLKKEYDCEVFGIEPDKNAFEIIQLKCWEAEINPNNFKQEYGENLSFKDNQFDFIHCFTVLEHVKNVKKCIDEMIRITKPGGKIYINTPNYTYPYEAHYKIPFPTFLSKIFSYLYLILLGKSPKFLKSINFLTEKSLNKILFQKNIKWFRICEPLPKSKGKFAFFLNYLKFKKFIYPNQEIIIIKNG